jgi:hypothetical protein
LFRVPPPPPPRPSQQLPSKPGWEPAAAQEPAARDGASATPSHGPPLAQPLSSAAACGAPAEASAQPLLVSPTAAHRLISKQLGGGSAAKQFRAAQAASRAPLGRAASSPLTSPLSSCPVSPGSRSDDAGRAGSASELAVWPDLRSPSESPMLQQLLRQ